MMYDVQRRRTSRINHQNQESAISDRVDRTVTRASSGSKCIINCEPYLSLLSLLFGAMYLRKLLRGLAKTATIQISENISTFEKAVLWFFPVFLASLCGVFGYSALKANDNRSLWHGTWGLVTAVALEFIIVERLYQNPRFPVSYRVCGSLVLIEIVDNALYRNLTRRKLVKIWIWIFPYFAIKNVEAFDQILTAKVNPDASILLRNVFDDLWFGTAWLVLHVLKAVISEKGMGSIQVGVQRQGKSDDEVDHLIQHTLDEGSHHPNETVGTSSLDYIVGGEGASVHGSPQDSSVQQEEREHLIRALLIANSNNLNATEGTDFNNFIVDVEGSSDTSSDDRYQELPTGPGSSIEVSQRLIHPPFNETENDLTVHALASWDESSDASTDGTDEGISSPIDSRTFFIQSNNCCHSQLSQSQESPAHDSGIICHWLSCSSVLEWSFTVLGFCIEIVAVVVDLLSSPKKPQYDGIALILSCVALVCCIGEFIYKVARAIAGPRRNCWLCLPDGRPLVSLYNFIGFSFAIYQVAVSASKFGDNPLNLCLYPPIFVVCCVVGKLVKPLLHNHQ